MPRLLATVSSKEEYDAVIQNVLLKFNAPNVSRKLQQRKILVDWLAKNVNNAKKLAEEWKILCTFSTLADSPIVSRFQMPRYDKCTASSSWWNGGTLAPNGKIYFIPGGADNILCFDPKKFSTKLLVPKEKKCEFSVKDYGITKWANGVVVGHVIYAAPLSARSVLRIDTSSDYAVTTFGYVDDVWEEQVREDGDEIWKPFSVELQARLTQFYAEMKDFDSSVQLNEKLPWTVNFSKMKKQVFPKSTQYFLENNVFLWVNPVMILLSWFHALFVHGSPSIEPIHLIRRAIWSLKLKIFEFEKVPEGS